jgi:hypothetical protein
MIRIRGTVGETPVDLTLELDDEDWSRLAGLKAPDAESASAQPATAMDSTAPPAPKPLDDPLWQTALSLVEAAGQVSGPQLLEQLEGLAGSTAAGKRLLVRLRHSDRIEIRSGDQAPLYCWKPT